MAKDLQATVDKETGQVTITEDDNTPLTESQQALYARATALWRPPERLTMSQWAEKHFQLESGKLRVIEFQKGFMDAFTDVSVEEISWMKSARVGATMTMIVAVVYYAAQDPMHLMLLEPTDDDAKGISTDHVAPAYERCTQTASMFAGSNAVRNTQTHKVFPGGSLKIVAAKSPRNLRRHDVDVLLLDEVDGYETTVEGDPIQLAKRRTQNSNRRKIAQASTPVNAQTSRISRSFYDSDQRYYFMPCPHCGVDQTYDWDYMCIDGVRVTTMKLKDLDLEGDWRAHMQCKDCGEAIHEDKKKWMVENGTWRATAPFRGHAGFHINTLVSPFPNASWQKLVLEYLRAKRSPDTLQTFVNTVLGLPWSDNLDNLDEESIAKRRGDYGLRMVPADVLLITVGVDIQKDRAELSYLGWNETETKVLAHEKIYGDPTGTKLWEDLDAALQRLYDHELGGTIGVAATAVDSGNWTQEVYKFCAGKQIRGIYAIKGVPGARPVWTESKIRPGDGAKLYNVGVETAKTILMQRLAIAEKGDGYIEFSSDLEFEYFEQLVSEYRQVEYVANRPVFKWHRKEGRRAETLDCFVYAMGARSTLSPNWEILRHSVMPDERREQSSSGFGALGRRAGGA